MATAAFKNATGIAMALQENLNARLRSKRRVLGKKYAPAQKVYYVCGPQGKALSVAGININAKVAMDDVCCAYQGNRWRCWAVRKAAAELLYIRTEFPLFSGTGGSFLYDLTNNKLVESLTLKDDSIVTFPHYYESALDLFLFDTAFRQKYGLYVPSALTLYNSALTVSMFYPGEEFYDTISGGLSWDFDWKAPGTVRYGNVSVVPQIYFLLYNDYYTRSGWAHRVDEYPTGEYALTNPSCSGLLHTNAPGYLWDRSDSGTVSLPNGVHSLSGSRTLPDGGRQEWLYHSCSRKYLNMTDFESMSGPTEYDFSNYTNCVLTPGGSGCGPNIWSTDPLSLFDLWVGDAENDQVFAIDANITVKFSGVRNQISSDYTLEASSVSIKTSFSQKKDFSASAMQRNTAIEGIISGEISRTGEIPILKLLYIREGYRLTA